MKHPHKYWANMILENSSNIYFMVTYSTYFSFISELAYYQYFHLGKTNYTSKSLIHMAHFYTVFKIEFVDGWHLPQSFFMEEEFFSIILASYHFVEELQQLVRIFLWKKTLFKAHRIIKLRKLRVILKLRLSALFIFKYDPFLCCFCYCIWFSKDTCSGTFRQIYRRLVSNKVIVLKPES